MVNSDALIAVVEDDDEIRRLVADLLAQDGFLVAPAPTGADLDAVLARRTPDLVILDLMLPGEDGLSICRRLRARGGVPILMLTAKSDAIDRVVGLELGADDYLVKPFEPRELVARVRAILRRARGMPEALPSRRYGFDGFVVDLDARRLETSGGAPVPLTSAEFDLLACFVQRPRRVLSRDQLLDWTRGRDAEPFDRTIDMTISRLRKKIEQAAPGTSLITTVRNTGYLFVATVKQLT
ncbi:response regulator [Rhodoplanes roseus]|uniref:Regulatory protein VirG n=1 Tax=Rhodoplanes roseus TaxID=29409 RepID=A0A327KU54_9BRAD|nr:response regulator transcription factor [Rhodoplanes roseus]RAI40965.1 DNA-binding response regulator [Rhodoplanes roseus]